MRSYELKISDFRYKREIPVLIGTMTVSVILVLLMFLIYLPLGIGFLISIVLLIINLYIAQMAMLGICVKVSERQFPKVYKMAQIAADRLHMELPPVYIMQSPILNAFATGFWGNYYIVLHSAILEACTDEELMIIIGHEFSHIKGNHVMINALMNMGVDNGMRLFPALAWLHFIIQFVFLYLSRCFEYTCDRGGLIATGDVRAFITCKTKLSVGKELFKTIDIMEFYKQALELDKKPFGFMAEIEATHPLTVNRIRQAVRFYRSDTYRGIAAMQGKAGTSTLQGSLETGDLMQRIINKSPANSANNAQGMTGESKYSNIYNYESNVKNGEILQELCKNCGTPRRANSLFCIVCGTKYRKPEEAAKSSDQYSTINKQNERRKEFSRKLCKRCGAENPEQALFCTECGEKL
jgi:Zn-dependent protease with chaperone function/ribosomal protein L40E